MESDALIKMNFLNNIQMWIRESVVIIFNISEQSLALSEINQINIFDEANEVDLMHLEDRNCRNEIKEIVSIYKLSKDY
jgi:hypothetical protein